MLTLVYKNNLEEIVGHIPISNFIFDINKHKNIKDAHKDDYSFELKLISPTSFETNYRCTPYKYYEAKSSKNHNPEEK